MIQDPEGLRLAALALLAARVAGLMVFTDAALRRRGPQHLLLVVGWAIYTASPAAAVLLGTGSPAFPALAAIGTAGVVIAALGSFRTIRVPTGLTLMAAAALPVAAIALARPALLGVVTLVVQVAMTLGLLVVVAVLGRQLRTLTPNGYRTLVWMAALHAAYAAGVMVAGAPGLSSVSLMGTLGLNVLVVAFFLQLERDTASKLLGESEALNQTIIASIPQKLFVKDTDGAYVAANDSYAAELGIAASEIAGRTDFDFFPPELAEKYRASDATVMRSGESVEFDESYSADGASRVVHTTKAPVRREGEVVGVVGLFEDVTYERMAESLLRESEARFRTAFEAAGAGISHVSLDGTVLRANRKLATMLGYEPGELVGRPTSAYVHPDHAREDLSLSGKLLSGELTESLGACRYVRKDGSILWVMLTVTLARSATGAPDYYVRVSEDITALKAAQEELESHRDHLERRVALRTEELQVANEELAAANEELQSLNEELAAANEELQSLNEELASTNEELAKATQAKSTFMASVSHELRTPLNSMIGFSKIMLDGLAGPLNAEQAKQLGMVHNAAQRQLELVDTLLDLERIEAGALRPKAAEFDLGEVLEEVSGLLEPQARKRGLYLRVDNEIEPPAVVTDRRFVWEILVNLATNAIKFTETGGVCLSVIAPPSSDTFAIRVSDTGCGLAVEDLERIFEPFEQAGDTRRRPLRDSIGLGLSIALGLAAALGGAIEVESASGDGSAFTLILPARYRPSED